MRSAASRHPPGVWILLWGVTSRPRWRAAARSPRLRPAPPAWDVAFRLVGGSFAACGLIAWRRRPDNGTGPLMVADRPDLPGGAAARPVRRPGQETLGLLLGDLWFVLARGAAALLPERPPPAPATRPGVIGAFALAFVVLGVVVAAVPRRARQPARGLPDAASPTRSTPCSARSRSAPRSPRSPCSRALASGGAAAAAGDAAELGGRREPAAVRRDAVQRSRHRRSRTRCWGCMWVCVIGPARAPAAFLAGLLRSRLARGGVRGSRRRAARAARRRAAGRAREHPRRPDAGARRLAAGVRGLRRRRGPGRAAARARQRPARHADRARRSPDRAARPRRVARDEPTLDAVCAAAALALDNEQLQTRVARTVGRAAGVARTDRRGGRRGAAAAGARPPRRRAAAAGRRGAAAAADPVRIHSRSRGGAARDQRRARSSPRHSTSCASSRAASIPRCSTRASTAALESLAARSPVLTSLSVDLAQPLPAPVELAVYFLVSEALTNVAKHARATAVTLRVSRNGARRAWRSPTTGAAARTRRTARA